MKAIIISVVTITILTLMFFIMKKGSRNPSNGGGSNISENTTEDPNKNINKEEQSN